MSDTKLQRAAWRWELRYLCLWGQTVTLTDREVARVRRLLKLLKVGPDTALMRSATDAAWRPR